MLAYLLLTMLLWRHVYYNLLCRYVFGVDHDRHATNYAPLTTRDPAVSPFVPAVPLFCWLWDAVVGSWILAFVTQISARHVVAKGVLS